ncbi:Plakophilin-4, variant 4 [Dermatophagoides farinae]|uniref:Plakophilin-4, variant 4 n=1 Tax=Dermatophagoides farinae TaxID=6954 RepID=A0A922HSI8_DERFA|nr:Plakophilin-4, variant 4 [Dermatophagoides farinae]
MHEEMLMSDMIDGRNVQNGTQTLVRAPIGGVPYFHLERYLPGEPVYAQVNRERKRQQQQQQLNQLHRNSPTQSLPPSQPPPPPPNHPTNGDPNMNHSPTVMVANIIMLIMYY